MALSIVRIEKNEGKWWSDLCKEVGACRRWRSCGEPTAEANRLSSCWPTT